MKEQILSYVHFVATGSGGEQVDPQVASTASNTGDPTLTIIACLLALIAAIAGVIYFKKYRPSVWANFAGAHRSSIQNSSFSGAKHMRPGATNNPVRPSVEDMHRGPAAKLSFVVFVVIAALAAVCAFASVQQNAMRVANAQNSAGLQNVAADTQAANKTNSDSQSLTVEPIVGTVDRDSQAISFAPSSITNNTERDIYVDATSLVKLAGIQDDDCTWTLKIDGTVVFESKATQEDLSNSAANAASICIKAGATDTVELSQTGLTYQTALGLADKDALKIGFDVSSFKTSTKMNDPEHGSITSNIPEYVSSKATYQVKDGVLYVDQDEQFSAEFDPTLAYAVDYWTANGTTIAESTPAAIDSDIEFVIYTKAVQVWDVRAEAEHGTVEPATAFSVNNYTGYTISDDNKTITFDDGQKITYTGTTGWAIKNWKIGESVAKQTGFIIADTTFTADEAQEYSVEVSVDNKDHGLVNSAESVSYTFQQGSKYKVDGESITFTKPDSTTETATFARNTGWQLTQWNLKDETEPLPSEETEITDNMDIVATTKMKTFEVRVETANSSSGDIEFSSGSTSPVTVQENSAYSTTENKIILTAAGGTDITATFNPKSSTIIQKVHGYSFDKWTKSATTNDNKITENTTFTALANEAYACYYENALEAEKIQAKTLYFYYDSERATRVAAGNTCYDMNTARKAPEWNTSASSFEHAVVAKNFHNFNTYVCRQWFDGMSNLKEAPQGCENINTIECTTMNKMFYKCCSANTTLADVPNVALWNVEKVTDFSYIFSQYGMQSTKLDAVPDVSLWKTDADEKTMACAFQSYGKGGTTASPQPCILSKVPDVSNWNMSGVTNISNMFDSYGQYSTVLNEVPNVANWDTSSVTDASCMFENYAKGDEDTPIKTIINKVPDVSKWNTSSMAFLSEMFEAYGAESTTLSVAPDVLTKEVGEGESKYTAWDLSSAEEMICFFSRYGSAASSNNIELKLNWDLANAPKITYVTQMFMGSSFKTIQCDKDWSSLSGILESECVEQMFMDCTNLVGGNGTTVSSEATDIARANPDKGTTAGPGYFTPTKTNYTLDINHDESANVDDVEWYQNGSVLPHAVGVAPVLENQTYGQEVTVKPQLSYFGIQIDSITDNNNTTYTPDAEGNITFTCKADLTITCNTSKITMPYTSSTANESETDDTTYDLVFYYNDGVSDEIKAGHKYKVIDLNDGGRVAPDDIYTKVKKVSFHESFKSVKVKSCSNWFNAFNALTMIEFTPGSANIDTTECISTNNMFASCTTLETLNILFLDTQNVQDMTAMFSGCKKLTTISNLNTILTNKVTSFSNMFFGCEVLNDSSVSGLSNWKTGLVQTMENMFNGCVALTTIDLSEWDTSNVTTMEAMFGTYSTSSTMNFKTIDITNFSNDSLVKTDSMFINCPVLSKILCNGWWNKSSILTSSNMMFYGCPSLPYYNVSKISSAYAHPTYNSEGYFFGQNYKINLDKTNVTWQDGEGATIAADYVEGLAGTDATLKPVANHSYGITSVTDDKGNTYELDSNGYVKGLKYTSEITLTANVKAAYAAYFDTATESYQAGDLVFFFDDNMSLKDHAYLMNKLDSSTPAQPETPGWITDYASSIKRVYFDSSYKDYKPTVCGKWFNSCANATFDFTNLDTSECANMGSMFSGCNTQTEIDISSFNVDKVTAMDGMFSSCTQLQNVKGLNDKNPVLLERAGSMFAHNTNLQKMDLSNWTMPNIVKLQGMFNYCSSITDIYLTSFYPSASTPLNSTLEMFQECKLLQNIYCNSNWTVCPGLTSETSKLMFQNCVKLPGFDASKVNVSQAYPHDTTGGYFAKHVYSVSLVGDDGMVWKKDGSEVTSPIEVNPGTSLALTASISETTRYKIDTITDDQGKSYTPDESGNITVDNITANMTITCKTSTGYACYYNSLYEGHAKGSFIFYYDNKRQTRTDAGCTCFSMNKLKSDGTAEAPAWANSTYQPNIKSVSFDTSFAKYKPYVCGYWFSGLTYGSLSLNFSNLDTSECVNMSSMFNGCSNLTILNVSTFDTSSVIRMDGMFGGLSSLGQVDGLQNFNTSNVQYMGSMFKECTQMTSFNFTGWDTSKVIKLQGMFSACSAVTSLDLSAFSSVSMVDDVYDMFANCGKLQTIKWNADLTGITTYEKMKNMFNNCSSLVGGNGTKYNDVYKDNQYARVDNSSHKGYFTATS